MLSIIFVFAPLIIFQLWDSASTFRGTTKRVARKIILKHYKFLPEFKRTESNKAEYDAIVKKNVTHLLGETTLCCTELDKDLNLYRDEMVSSALGKIFYR